MFSQTVEYALRAMIYLASLSPGEISSAGRIAEAVQVPSRYLSKVMRGLVVAKLVESTRGPNGGFVLRSSPDTITLRDIVDAVGSGGARAVRGREGEPVPGRHASPSWRSAMQNVERAMRSTTLSEMLQEHQKSKEDQGHCAD